MKELYLIFYLMIMNLVTFVLMGIDKYKARKYRWRIQERSFILLSLLGGALGSIMGMVVFRHKTQHKSFYIGMPVVYLFNKIIIQIIMVKIIK